VHLSPSVPITFLEDTCDLQIVTPAIPTHSCIICSQITNCTLLPVWRSPEPRPVNIAQYEVRFPAFLSSWETLRISWNSASAKTFSCPSLPRSLSKIKRASSSRPTFTSHLGDSGNHQTMMNNTRRGMIWKAMGNLQRIGEAPWSMNESPLEGCEFEILD
jgi:hypothetical protein